MSVDKLINDATEGGDESTETELTGLAKMINFKRQYKKFKRKDICPSCGEDDTEKHHYYWRCNNSSCDTLTYMHSNHEVDLLKGWK